MIFPNKVTRSNVFNKGNSREVLTDLVSTDEGREDGDRQPILWKCWRSAMAGGMGIALPLNEKIIV